MITLGYKVMPYMVMVSVYIPLSVVGLIPLSGGQLKSVETG